MAEREAPPPAVELKGLTKAYGALMACRGVSIAVAKGSVHALVGENGAGKSTCVKMLYGLVKPDLGEILVHGAPRRWRGPRDAGLAGLGMVHQHFMLAPPLSGLDNIILGAEPRRAKWSPVLDRAGARRRLNELAAAYHFQVDLDRPVDGLPVGTQQRLEILKLLYRNADILILDEPTAVLTPQEVDELFANLRRLTAEGKTILVITHKLGEVLRFCDAFTVLRRGEVVATRPVAGATAALIAEMMVGHAVHLHRAPPPLPDPHRPMALELEGVTFPAPYGRGVPRLSNICLGVRAGEIVGIAGVEGNGQSELLRLILSPRSAFAGLGRRNPPATGAIRFFGADARAVDTRAARALGVGVVPEDRHRQGLLLDLDLQQNFLLGHQRRPAFACRGLVRFQALRQRLQAQLAAFDVRPADPLARAGGLSGGNQQKLIMARELEAVPRLLLAAQPTRGVDVGSIELIHDKLLAARAAGAAILLISSELEEVMGLADRILVFFAGRIVAEFRRGEADERALGRAMGGANA